MRRKSRPGENSRRKTRSGTSDARRVDTFRPRRRSASCWKGSRGEESIAELCRRESIASSMYYGWSKEFLEAGKRRLACRRHGRRAATSDEVKDLPPRRARVEGGRGRSHPRKPTAQKKHDRGWGRRGMR